MHKSFLTDVYLLLLQILSLLTLMSAAFFLLIVCKTWINSCIPTVLQLSLLMTSCSKQWNLLMDWNRYETNTNKDLINWFSQLLWVRWQYSTDMLQVVLLTDGLDTRPYRLNWPTSTLVFGICPEKVFRGAVQKLQGFNILFPFCLSSSPYILIVGVWTSKSMGTNAQLTPFCMSSRFLFMRFSILFLFYFW